VPRRCSSGRLTGDTNAMNRGAQDERPPDYWAERGYDWYAGL